MKIGYMFRALRHRNFRLLWLGQMTSLIGTWMQRTAQAWLVFRLTDSPFYLGLVYAVNYLPILLLSPMAGTVADRVDKRDLLVATQIFSMLQALILATLTVTGLIAAWHIVLLAGMIGIVNAFDAPARHSIVRDLVDMEDLRNAIALNSSIFNAARMTGPAIAGALIPLIGEGGCFCINCVTFVVIIVCLVLMRAVPPSPRKAKSLILDLKEGFIYIKKDIMVFMLLTTVGMNSIFGMSYAVLMPVFARDIFAKGPEALGLLMSAVGIGAVIGVLRMAHGVSKSKIGAVVVKGLTFSISLILFSYSSWFYVSLILLFVMGWALVTKVVTINSLIQEAVPDELRSRIMSVYILMLLGMIPVGSLLAGTLAQAIGAPWTVRINALILGSYILLLAKMAIPTQVKRKTSGLHRRED